MAQKTLEKNQLCQDSQNMQQNFIDRAENLNTET